MRLSFFGAAGTVTGSRYLLETGERTLLIDCGMFQGFKQLRLRNWAKLPFEAAAVDAVLLTHAHIDHCGYIPRLLRQGFRGKVFCSAATLELCRILLPDAARLHEEDAKFANRHGFSRHHPALPLYNQADAAEALEHFTAVPVGSAFEPVARLAARFTPAGHILGATCVRVERRGVAVTFSGDIGRPDDPLMRAPEAPAATDYLVTESTYGDRRHPSIDPQAELGRWLQRAALPGGVSVIP